MGSASRGGSDWATIPDTRRAASSTPFPFPTLPLSSHAIGDLAEELDATRKEVLAEHSDLTLTGLYNLREKLVKDEPFSEAEQDQRRRGGSTSSPSCTIASMPPSPMPMAGRMT